MKYINKTISLKSDEKTFIKTLVSEIKSFSERVGGMKITPLLSDTDIDDLFTESKLDLTPTITFKIGSNTSVVLERKKALKYNTQIYNIKVLNDLKGSTEVISDYISFANKPLKCSDSVERKVMVTVRFDKNTNTTNFIIGSCQASVIPNHSNIAISVVSDTEFVVSKTSVTVVNNFVTNEVLKVYCGGFKDEQISFASIPDNKITIGNIVNTENDYLGEDKDISVIAFKTKKAFDNSVVVVENKRYFAISENLFIPCNEDIYKGDNKNDKDDGGGSDCNCKDSIPLNYISTQAESRNFLNLSESTIINNGTSLDDISSTTEESLSYLSKEE